MTIKPESKIIVPPDNIKATIEKTVGYVKKNGTSFEERLKNNSENKFEFLNEDNKYNTYYKLLLSEQDKIDTELGVPIPEVEDAVHPRYFKFMTELPTVSQLDLDIVKLTALFVSQNGPEYILKLMNHAKKNNNIAQFEFLNKNHSLNQLFEKYIKQYKLLIEFYTSDGCNESEEIEDIKNILQNSNTMLKAAFERAKYDKNHKRKSKNDKKSQEQKQLQYASTDWQDYSIVGKIEFDAVDLVKELPAPISREDIIYRSLEAKRKELDLQKFEAPISQRVDDKKEIIQSEEDISKKYSIPKGLKIKAAGESRLKTRKPEKSSANEPAVACPITGQLIPESKFDDHLKILLRDPKYKEQQDNYLKKNFKYASNLSTDEVYDNIKRLARKRDGSPIVSSSKRSQIGPSI